MPDIVDASWSARSMTAQDDGDEAAGDRLRRAWMPLTRRTVRRTPQYARVMDVSDDVAPCRLPVPKAAVAPRP